MLYKNIMLSLTYASIFHVKKNDNCMNYYDEIWGPWTVVSNCVTWQYYHIICLRQNKDNSKSIRLTGWEARVYRINMLTLHGIQHITHQPTCAHHWLLFTTIFQVTSNKMSGRMHSPCVHCTQAKMLLSQYRPLYFLYHHQQYQTETVCYTPILPPFWWSL